MSDTIRVLQKNLQESIDSTPQRISIFFKTGPGDYAEHDRFMGITVRTLRKIAKKFISIALHDLSLLIQSSLNEERLCALIILNQQYKIGTATQKDEIYRFYIANLRYVNNWNLVDSSAHLIVGAHLFERDYSILEELAKSQRLWERRISIIATWYFIRKAELQWTFKIARLLLNDSHDPIHKAVGWMLREAGKQNQIMLVNFLSEHAQQMPKTMLRAAMEKLSKK